MKKSLFTAGALAMMVASCTNDAIEEAGVQSNGTRPSAGQVVLKLNPTGNDETRATWTGTGWTFNEESDRFAAMLMDEWNKVGSGIGAYKLVDYIQTNYPFKSEDGGYTWSSVAGAPLCEGNYFFTYPFNPEHTSRKTISFTVPAVQKVYEEGSTEVDAILPVKFYQHYLGYAFIPASNGEVNEVAPMFHPLFANPKFKFKNETGTELKILKVLVRTHQDGKAGSPELMPTTTELRPGTGEFGHVCEMFGGKEPINKLYAEGKLQDNSQTTYAKIYKQEIAALFSHATTPKDGFFGSNEDEGVYEYVIDCGDNYVVNNRDYVRVSAVMPAGEYHNFDVYLFVEDNVGDKGIVRLNNTAKAYWNEADVETGSMQTVLKPGITQVYTAAFGNDAIENLGIKDFTVVNSEDLLFVADLKAKDGGRDLVTIKTMGDKVVLNKDIYNLFSAENRKGIKWQIDGTIVIPADAEADAIDQLTTGSSNVVTTIINYGNQILSKDLDDVVVINYGTIAEKTNVEIDIDGDVYVKAGKVEVDDITGDVVVDSKAELIADAISGSVKNSGTLNASSITDENSLTCKDGHKVAVINNAGAELKVSGTINGAMCNWGTATAKTVTGALRNMGTMTVNNAPAFSNKSTGTMNFVGTTDDIVSGSNGAANRGGVINVTGTTDFAQLFNDGATLNINADVTFTGLVENGYGEHKFVKDKIIATINIAKDKTVKVKSPAELRNSKNAVINVEGNLGDNIKNSGEVFVKGQGQFIANGIVSEYSKDVIEFNKEFTKGIIDVTAADGTENDAQKARDMVAGGSQDTNQVADKSNAFRYTIKKSTDAKELAAALKSRISSSNFLNNEVIIEFDANSKINYYGEFVKTMIKISHVLVKSGTELTFTATGDTKKVNFPFLHNTQDPATCPAYNAFEVASGAKLMVADKVTVTLPDGIDFWANGEVNANDHSTLVGNVTIKGAGKFWNSTANCAWKLDTTGKWKGEDYGF